MSMQDPISDMFTRIRNGLHSKKKYVSCYLSKKKQAIANVLLTEGFIKGISIEKSNNIQFLKIYLKYKNEKSVIVTLTRISKPSLRIYKKYKDFYNIQSGLGINIISTSKGLMSDKKAKSNRLGGEVICYVS